MGRVIRLLGCCLLCKVFALCAFHTDASHFCPHRLYIASRYDNIEVWLPEYGLKPILDGCTRPLGHTTEIRVALRIDL